MDELCVEHELVVGAGRGTQSVVPPTPGDRTTPPCLPQQRDIAADLLPVTSTGRDESLGTGRGVGMSLAPPSEGAHPSPLPANIPKKLLQTDIPPRADEKGLAQP